MRFKTTGERVTPQNARDHHPMCFYVRRDFHATQINPIGPGVELRYENTFHKGDFIRGESWRPEGVIMCRRINAEGMYLDDKPEMWLSWVDLGYNCELATEGSDE